VLDETTRELETDLVSARDQRAHLGAWRDQGITQGDRMEKLKVLARLAGTRLTRMPVEDRQRIVRLMNLRVGVLGWSECGECKGRGKVAGGRGGVNCPSCGGTRHIASLRIEGVVWDWLGSAIEGDKEPERSSSSSGDRSGLAVPFQLDAQATAS
jgi:hypothetical protein